MQQWSRIALTVFALMAGFLGGLSVRAATPNSACSLTTADELRAALGARMVGLLLSADDLRVALGYRGDASYCSGDTEVAAIGLRLVTRSSPEDAEAARIEAAKKMGAQVEVKTDGPITCWTTIPANQAQLGFKTTCSVLKNGHVAAIEVTAWSRQDMVSIETLRPVAESMVGRF
jgi:hypothetical protein